MKRLTAVLLCFALSFGLVSQEAFARVGTISVMNSYNKSASTVTTYVKNSDNKSGKHVKLELQKNGRTVNVSSVYVKKNTQLKKLFKLSSKGKYRIKYTTGGRYSYTNNFYK